MGLYNQAVSQYLGTMASSDPCTDFAQSLQLAAKHNLTKIPVTQKKDYISADTWKLIEEKEAAITAGDYARSQTLSPIIKKMARKDRENMILEQLQAADAQGYKWDGLKAARKTFQPKRVKFRNAEGNLIKESDFAAEAARYLSEVQWAPPNHTDLNADYETQILYSGGNTMIRSIPTFH